MKEYILQLPICVSFILFAVYPSFQSALIVTAALSFVAFQKLIETKSKKEIDQLRDEFKQLKNQVDGLQLQRTLGR